ncbi:phosphodiester glycosidase family protein [Anaerocolumna xylanovorans]|uniref:Exopolysaccharide biosynthesis protein n=1 Tax=Anaerocolumna xylanovorans DSM 12503 TaxID=1121345 RepID=A0A1M7YFE7_9FIRM|nr:phosphodiester glycosidase family protein [Anaerocolumna xylanovorans]SHO51365.1 Exopolysaccharide biosynthesis protein [Anaerocolumna xylanovorans DSM 12503]
MHTDKKHSKKPIIILIPVVLLIAVLLYMAANRYLIRHVKVNNALDTANTGTEDSDTEYTADDWNYNSDTVTIKINKMTTGTGNDTITYYTADVTIKDSSSLKSAFADNKFGQNIVEDTSIIASTNNAIFAINGDYYGFRDDGIIIRNGKIFRDVPARTGLSFYSDGSMKIYDEATTTAEELVKEGVTQTLSFGPALVENGKAITGLGKTEIDTNFGNHTIQGSNPRTGVGIISPNHYVFVVVDGRSRGYSKGMTLDEFSELFVSLGCTDAYNLDGGGSSTMYFMGKVVNSPLGKDKERGVSDILYIG